jgi:hypothetical protein
MKHRTSNQYKNVWILLVIKVLLLPEFMIRITFTVHEKNKWKNLVGCWFREPLFVLKKLSSFHWSLSKINLGKNM